MFWLNLVSNIQSSFSIHSLDGLLWLVQTNATQIWLSRSGWSASCILVCYALRVCDDLHCGTFWYGKRYVKICFLKKAPPLTFPHLFKVRTRLMNQSLQGPRMYNSFMDCAFKIVKNEGPIALWTGFIPMWSRIGPTAILQLILFEKITQLTGGKTL